MQLIAAVDENWAIGYGGRLLCPVKADLRRFKALTMGHGVLLGRKTLSTFPGGRPLPGRENFILSRDPAFEAEGARVVHSADEALRLCPRDTFVIGGAQVYRLMLEHCDKAYITKLRAAFPADAWLPDLDALPDWEKAEEGETLEEGNVRFQYILYRRSSPAQHGKT